jgi:hypothetical protein
VIPMYEELAIRIEFLGDDIARLMMLHPLTGEVLSETDEVHIAPASYYVASPERMERAIRGIEEELEQRLGEMERAGKLLEAQRLRMRTQYDVEMMRQVGFCSGIENYSRHIEGREPGSPPNCLIDYFPDDFLLVIDESYVTVPQIGGMYEGDMSGSGRWSSTASGCRRQWTTRGYAASVTARASTAARDVRPCCGCRRGRGRRRVRVPVSGAAGDRARARIAASAVRQAEAMSDEELESYLFPGGGVAS